MLAARLHQPTPIEERPLRLEQVSRPVAGPGEVLLKVRICGLCRTDLHIVEGEVEAPGYPVIPGHQVVGEVVDLGPEVDHWRLGQRAGLPWLFRTDESCDFCRRGLENLCPAAEFTGLDRPGGYAEYVVADAAFALPLPETMSDEQTAPLLCAGIIGYRSLRQADLKPGERVGLVGFGASAHLALQVARHWGCQVYVFTRSQTHRQLARRLGAAWAGGAEDQPPHPLDCGVIFAPDGQLVPMILDKLRPGGTLAINAIHLSPIPQMDYERIYGERTLRSVANLTRQDGHEFLALAAQIPIEAQVTSYPLTDANQALADLKHSRIDGAAVLTL
ncbi:MAG TPA: zinc-dependent alcohol dehydrogenase family protein [Anaerolineales bacterium]|jgi:propanol-preferring alcohol dehydrogenase